MEKYFLGIVGIAFCFIYAFGKEMPLEIGLIAVILISAACICKKLEEIRDKEMVQGTHTNNKLEPLTFTKLKEVIVQFKKEHPEPPIVRIECDVFHYASLWWAQIASKGSDSLIQPDGKSHLKIGVIPLNGIPICLNPNLKVPFKIIRKEKNAK